MNGKQSRRLRREAGGVELSGHVLYRGIRYSDPKKPEGFRTTLVVSSKGRKKYKYLKKEFRSINRPF